MDALAQRDYIHVQCYAKRTHSEKKTLLLDPEQTGKHTPATRQGEDCQEAVFKKFREARRAVDISGEITHTTVSTTPAAIQIVIAEHQHRSRSTFTEPRETLSECVSRVGLGKASGHHPPAMGGSGETGTRRKFLEEDRQREVAISTHHTRSSTQHFLVRASYGRQIFRASKKMPESSARCTATRSTAMPSTPGHGRQGHNLRKRTPGPYGGELSADKCGQPCQKRSQTKR